MVSVVFISRRELNPLCLLRPGLKVGWMVLSAHSGGSRPQCAGQLVRARDFPGPRGDGGLPPCSTASTIATAGAL